MLTHYGVSQIYRSLCVFAMCMLTMVGATSSAYATVGEDDALDILGFDPVDNKVFFTIMDESAIDDVYYIKLGSTNQPVLAKSLYPEEKDLCNEPPCSTILNQRIEQLQKRLTPLSPTATEYLQWRTLTKKSQIIPWYNDPELPTPEHDISYRIIFDNGVQKLSGQSHLVYYRDDLVIDQAFRIPNRPHMVAVVKYLGKPFEFGYKKYDVVILSPNK